MLTTDNVTEAQFRAMAAIFELAEAVGDKSLSIGSLADVMNLAIEEGHDTIMVALNMVLFALQMSADAKANS